MLNQAGLTSETALCTLYIAALGLYHSQEGQNSSKLLFVAGETKTQRPKRIILEYITKHPGFHNLLTSRLKG